MTGGVSNEDDAPHKAEVILPDGRSCTMPDLPSLGRFGHTQSGLTACGGGENDGTRTSCDSFTGGQWERSHELHDERHEHVSWQSPHGILLIGGANKNAKRTTELLSSTDSTTTNLFNLPYSTMYIDSIGWVHDLFKIHT